MHRATRNERARTERITELSELVGDLYEAALDRRRWPDVLMRVAGFAGGTAADLPFADIAAHYGMIGFDDRPHGPDGRYRPDSGKQVAGGGPGYSHHPLANAHAFERIQSIGPHMQRAIRIGRLIESRDEMSATFACALDGLDAAVFLIDSAGRLLHANAAAYSIVVADEILRIGAGGRLAVCGAPATDRDLQDALTVACRRSDVPAQAEAAVPLIGRDGARYVAHVLPLNSTAPDRGDVDRAAAAALFVHKVVVPVSSASDAIGKAFRLTPAELRILTAIVELGGVPVVAAALGLSEATVKTHLIHIFRKTGARRQQDLVRLAARYVTPLAR